MQVGRYPRIGDRKYNIRLNLLGHNKSELSNSNKVPPVSTNRIQTKHRTDKKAQHRFGHRQSSPMDIWSCLQRESHGIETLGYGVRHKMPFMPLFVMFMALLYFWSYTLLPEDNLFGHINQ